MRPADTTTAVAAERGLSSAEAAFQLRRDGPNELPTERPPSPIVELLRQLAHFFALMLWVAGLWRQWPGCRSWPWPSPWSS